MGGLGTRAVRLVRVRKVVTTSQRVQGSPDDEDSQYSDVHVIQPNILYHQENSGYNPPTHQLSPFLA